MSAFIFAGQKRTDLRSVRKSLRNRTATVLQALTQRACVKNASFFSRPLHSEPLLLTPSTPSPFSNAQVSARAHGAFYAGDPPAVLCNFLFDFSRRLGQEGSNRFTILTNEFLEVARGAGGGDGPFRTSRVRFLPQFLLSPFLPLSGGASFHASYNLTSLSTRSIDRHYFNAPIARPFPRDPLRPLPTRRDVSGFRRILILIPSRQRFWYGRLLFKSNANWTFRLESEYS